MIGTALLLLLQSVTAGPAVELAGPRVRESSGIAMSRAHPGIAWTHNDSGDEPRLYATDLRGRDLGWLRIPGASAVDWEDLSLGPCPRRSAAPTCLFIADAGDNSERRRRVRIYAIPEPAPPTGPGDTLRTTAAPAVLNLRYPDGSHDVEAIYVSPRDSALYLVSKGISGRIRLYRVGPQHWGEDESAARDRVAVATRVQTLDILPHREAGRLVTGAGIRPDGRLVAVRTYTEVYLFYPGVGGRLVPVRERPCNIAGLDRGGEAIDFVNDTTLVITSEASRRGPGTIRTLVCRR